MKNPAIFQGNLKNSNYFEGWYFKQIDPKKGKGISIIPGVSLIGENRHAFIQLFDGFKNKSYYIQYPIESFKPEKDPFKVKIGDNRFSLSGLELDINADVSIKGSLSYSDNVLFPSHWYMRGAMGLYGYVPFLEIYHGLLSFDHTVNGSVTINGERHEFIGSRGYIEKDWGTSFPPSWIWMQANCFKDEKISFVIIIAVVPWMGLRIIGHVAVFYLNGEFFNLSTYYGSKLTDLEKTPTGIRLKIEDHKNLLFVNASGGEFVNLKSPENGVMTGRTAESLSSVIEVSLYSKKENKLLYTGVSSGAGLEIMDDKNLLIKK